VRPEKDMTMASLDADFSDIEAIMSYSFKRPYLLLDSLTRRSYWHENRNSCEHHNERLEFLGDAVLGLVIAEKLYEEFPEFEEGDLQKSRAKLVNRTTLANLARDLGIAKFIRMGRGDELSGCRDRDSILADTLEALIAAVFLDGGFPAAKEFILRVFSDLIDTLPTSSEEQDYKSLFQERVQSSMGLTPTYHVVAQWGEEHCKTFAVAVQVGDNTVGQGTGRNKREAAQNAARDALNSLFK
jgi:ribonuclease-3